MIDNVNHPSLKNGRVYMMSDDGKPQPIGRITEADLESMDKTYDVNAWDDDMTITFKCSWLQRLKFKFLIWKAMRKEKRKKK